MKKLLLLILISALFFSCSSKKPEKIPRVTVQEIVIQEIEPREIPAPVLIEEVELWATYYFMPSFTQDKNGVELRDINNKPLGVKLSISDYCSISMEGTGFIDGKTYNYSGTTRKHKVKCKHRASGYVKFYVTKHPYGVGNKNNPLIPFVSIACDQSRFKFGQKFFIPSAVGTLLPSGKKHDGNFICGDVGGLIKGNHIDVFIGGATKNPFKFVTSSKNKTFKAFLDDSAL